jgi:hypothetical protein
MDPEERLRRARLEMRKAFRVPLRQEGIDYAQYAVLEELWMDPDGMTADCIAASVAGRFGRRPYPTMDQYTWRYDDVIVPVEEEQARTALRTLVRDQCVRPVSKGCPPHAVTLYQLSPKGFRLFERIQTSVFGKGAWRECYKVRRKGIRRYQVVAPNDAALFWGLEDIIEKRFILRCHSWRQVGKWRYNRLKSFDSGVAVDVLLGKRIEEDPERDDVEWHVHRFIRERAAETGREIPPTAGDFDRERGARGEIRRLLCGQDRAEGSGARAAETHAVSAFRPER